MTIAAGSQRAMFARMYGVLRWLLPVVAAGLLIVAGLALLWWFLAPIADRLGVAEDDRLDIIRVYLLAAGGLLLIWQIAVANRRASSAERVAELTALANITDRLNAAIVNLGNENPVVRIGALYQLHHIAVDAADYRRTVFELVKSHSDLITPEPDAELGRDDQRTVELATVAWMLYQKVDEGGLYYGPENEEVGR